MAKAASARAPGDPALGEVFTEGSWHTRCDRCGALYDLSGWLKLALVTRVESSWLAEHVTVWRADDVVEVRRCVRCERTVSRRRPAANDNKDATDERKRA